MRISHLIRRGTAVFTAVFALVLVVNAAPAKAATATLQGTVLDFNQGSSRILEDGNLSVTTDDLLFLNAKQVVIKNDAQVNERLIIANGNIDRDTGSGLYDNGDLNVVTDDNLWLRAPGYVQISNGLRVNNGLAVYGGTVTLPAGSITAAMLASGVSSSNLGTGSVTSTHIADGTITVDDIATSGVATAEILDGTILAGDIATGAVTTTSILDSTVASADIAADTIAAADIATGGVETTEILDGTILTGDISLDTILAADIAADAVGTSEILDSTVASADIAADTIDGVDLADTITLDAALALNGAAVSTDNTFTASVLYTTGGAVDATITGTILHIGETFATGGIILDQATTVDGSLAANGGITVDSTNFIVSGTTGDITTAGDLTVNGGQIYVTPVSTSASTTEGTIYYDSDDDNLYVYANGAYVDLTAGAGGVSTLDDAYNASAGASTVLVDAGTLTWQSSGAYDIITNLAGTGDFVVKDNGTDVFTISDTGNTTIATGTLALNNDTVTSDGDLAVTGATGANLTATLGDLDVTSTAGSIILTAGENATDSIQITSSVGGINIAASGASATEDITLTATGSSVQLTSTEAAADAIKLNASNAAGGIDVNAGTGTIDVLQTGTIAGNGVIIATTDAGISLSAVGAGNGDITLATGDDLDINVTGDATLDAVGVSIDGTAASNLTVTGAAADLTLSSVGGSVNVTASEAAADAIVLNASAGGVDITAATNNMDLLASTLDVNITGTVNVDTVATTGNITNAASAGAIDLDSATYTMDTTSSFSIDGAATASNITLTGDGAGDNLTVSVAGATASSLILSSAGTGANALQITTTAGGIDITAGGNGAGEDLDIVATGAATEVRIGGASTEADAIAIQASAGGIDIDADAASTISTTNDQLTIATGTDDVVLSGNADGTAALTVTAGDVTLSNGDLTVAGGDFNVTLDTADGVTIASTASTATTGIIDMNVTAGDAAVDGLNISLTQNDGATAARDATAAEILLTGNDADGDMFGLTITGAATANATTGTYESGISIDNAEDTAASMTDGILVTSSGVDAGVTDAIDVSAANITNAINVGANVVLGTTAVINFSNFDVDANGVITTADDLHVNGDNIDADGTLVVTGATGLTLAATLGNATTTGATDASVTATAGDVTLTSGDDILLNPTDDITATLAAGGQVTIDASSTANTTTTGVIDMNVGAGNAAVDGLNIAMTQNDGATAATDATAAEILLTGNDADGDMFGLTITGAATTNATTGTYEAGIFIDNAENTAASMTDGILITSSGANTGVTDAIDVSAANITNAINVGANVVLGTTANIDLDNFDVVGSTGNITTAGDLAVNGENIDADGTLVVTGATGLTLAATLGNATMTGATDAGVTGTAGDVTLTAGDDVIFAPTDDIAANMAAGGIVKIDSADSASDVVTLTFEDSVVDANHALAGTAYAANTTKFSVDTDGDTSIGGKVVLGRQTSAVNGGATNAVTATASYIEFTTAAGGDDVVQLAAGTEGQVVIMVNLASGTVAIDQSATVMLKGGADVTLTTNDTIMLIFDGTAWHEITEELTNG